MIDDPSVQQARVLLAALIEQVIGISRDLEAADEYNCRARVGGRSLDTRAESLRRELYEVHRLIDGIHKRFPETRPPAVRRPQG